MTMQMNEQDQALLTNLIIGSNRTIPGDNGKKVSTTECAHKTGNEPVYDVLDKNEFKRRMGDSFPAVYLTVISIVQGVALGILAQNTFGYISSMGPTNIEAWIAIVPYAVLSFLTIIIVSFEYNWFVGVYRWSPKFFDTFIPFALGVAQIGPTYFLASPQAWWTLNVVFVIVGTIAFSNTIFNCNRDMFISDEVYNLTQRGVYVDVVITSLLVMILILTAIYYEESEKIYYWHAYEIIALFIYLLVIVLLFYKEEAFVKDLHQAYGLKY